MSTAAIQMRAHLRHRGVIFWSLFPPVLFYGAILTIQAVQGRSSASISLWGLLALAASAAFFLASGQQEILTRPTFYLLPGLARGMAANQVRLGLVVGAVAAAGSLLLPGLRPLMAGEPARLVSVFCLAILTYSLVMQLALQFSHLNWIVFQVVWLQFLLVKAILAVPDPVLATALDQASLWVAAMVVGVFLVQQQLRSRGLHRRIAERPYLSIADVKNNDKVAEFKRRRNLHKDDRAGGPRPLAGLMTRALRRAEAARRAGRDAAALTWEAVAVTLMTSMARHWWKVLLALAIVPVFMVFGGYFDARSLARGKDWVGAWFVNIPFMGIAYFGILGTYLRHPGAGRLWARQTRVDALWPTLVAMLALSYAATAVLYGYGHLAASLAPPVTVDGDVLRMVPPSRPVLAWPVVCHLVQLMVWSLWRSPRCVGVMQQVGTVAFFPFMIFVQMWYGPFAWGAVGIVCALLLVTLPLVWSWRVMRTDQA